MQSLVSSTHWCTHSSSGVCTYCEQRDWGVRRVGELWYAPNPFAHTSATWQRTRTHSQTCEYTNAWMTQLDKAINCVVCAAFRRRDEVQKVENQIGKKENDIWIWTSLCVNTISIANCNRHDTCYEYLSDGICLHLLSTLKYRFLRFGLLRWAADCSRKNTPVDTSTAWRTPRNGVHDVLEDINWFWLHNKECCQRREGGYFG